VERENWRESSQSILSPTNTTSPSQEDGTEAKKKNEDEGEPNNNNNSNDERVTSTWHEYEREKGGRLRGPSSNETQQEGYM